MGSLRAPTPVRERPAGRAEGMAPHETLRNERIVQLLGGIAHEVRNPLHAMAIHLEVLVDKLRDPAGRLPEGSDRNVQAIRSQIRKLDEMIRRLTDFAQRRSETVPVHELIAGAVELCAYPLRRAGVEVRVEVDDDLGHLKSADPFLFAVVEVLLSAVDSEAPGGALCIRGELDGERVRLRFTGPGATGPRMDAARLALLSRLVAESGGALEGGEGKGWTLTVAPMR